MHVLSRVHKLDLFLKSNPSTTTSAPFLNSAYNNTQKLLIGLSENVPWHKTTQSFGNKRQKSVKSSSDYWKCNTIRKVSPGNDDVTYINYSTVLAKPSHILYQCSAIPTTHLLRTVYTQYTLPHWINSTINIPITPTPQRYIFMRSTFRCDSCWCIQPKYHHHRVLNLFPTV